MNTQATFYDWFLIWEIAAVGVTGLGSTASSLGGNAEYWAT